MKFEDFCKNSESLDPQNLEISNELTLSFNNKTDKSFQIRLSTLLEFIRYLNDFYDNIYTAWEQIPSRKNSINIFEEKSYRAIYTTASDIDNLKSIAAMGGSQTKQLTAVIAKIICYLSNQNYAGITVNTFFDKTNLSNALINKELLLRYKIRESAEESNINYEKIFQKWLGDKGLNEVTIKKYSSDTGKFIFKILSKINHDFNNIFTIKNLSDLYKIEILLENDDAWLDANNKGNNMYSSGLKKYHVFLTELNSQITLPKSFLLLAGISGTGKSRFIREQAKQRMLGGDNFRLIPVRPDWHEPSDLIGYVSRITTERYVTTPLLEFIVSAWINAYSSADSSEIKLKPLESITTYWACLDEMNLAPVEQYFADYLSVIETREWKGIEYKCDSLVHPAQLISTGALDILKSDLKLEMHSGLWEYFKANGIPLPPNLIVAGTVNMDETTHGFSRKVIDRAFTIDFGEFFPNNFDKFFTPDTMPKNLSFARYSDGRSSISSVTIDSTGEKSITFLKQINSILTGTPFELAFRALNELLLSVVCFNPADELTLKAVWDDFLMAKLLPRIEGDAEKLQFDGSSSLLTKLEILNTDLFKPELTEGKRPDLFRSGIDGEIVQVPFRSLKKLEWMQKRLVDQGFTSFWP